MAKKFTTAIPSWLSDDMTPTHSATGASGKNFLCDEQRDPLAVFPNLSHFPTEGNQDGGLVFKMFHTSHIEEHRKKNLPCVYCPCGVAAAKVIWKNQIKLVCGQVTGMITSTKGCRFNMLGDQTVKIWNSRQASAKAEIDAYEKTGDPTKKAEQLKALTRFRYFNLLKCSAPPQTAVLYNFKDQEPVPSFKCGVFQCVLCTVPHTFLCPTREKWLADKYRVLNETELLQLREKAVTKFQYPLTEFLNETVNDKIIADAEHVEIPDDDQNLSIKDISPIEVIPDSDEDRSQSIIAIPSVDKPVKAAAKKPPQVARKQKRIAVEPSTSGLPKIKKVKKVLHTVSSEEEELPVIVVQRKKQKKTNKAALTAAKYMSDEEDPEEGEILEQQEEPAVVVQGYKKIRKTTKPPLTHLKYVLDDDPVTRLEKLVSEDQVQQRRKTKKANRPTQVDQDEDTLELADALDNLYSDDEQC